ncbi:MAG: hypothetical protein KVP17_000914 [Porospora cf. gigantea B]|uniref:uncharacterized protein n=1 Tax=Porospora cf. gigantea B TaxID=2853592 RepID=UPI0035719273|nr:MAG: hypothetical protein KVP17_000914 [Porospora cf. gigantea B]
MISVQETRFMLDGVRQNFRNDGRNNGDLRSLQLSVGVTPTAFGSAKVIWGRNEVVVGVTCQLVKLPVVSEFAPVNISIFDAGQSQAHTHVASVLTSLLLNTNIVPDVHKCYRWQVHVDACLLNVGGNLLDVVGLGINAALRHCRLPHVIFTENENADWDFEVDDRPEAGHPLFNLDRLPVPVSCGTLGDHLCWDLTQEEEPASGCRITCAVVEDGHVMGMHTSGALMDLSLTSRIISRSVENGMLLHKTIKESL